MTSATGSSGTTKADWRRRLLAARRARSLADRAAADSALVNTLMSTCGERGVRVAAAYSPLLTEPGGPGLLPALASVASSVLIPVLLADRDLDWEAWSATGPLLGKAAIGRADLVVVPAVAVDLRGVRLGRGGGSYDRALTRVAPGALVVALLFDGELVDALPAEPHDRRVDAVITPSGGLRHVG
ncbi:5-formyltetrahydrofolate cyclo-ligase [Luedemannella helvata]|uniref:5-formyltetrahydrofolate cyclo-ligase n=1 Tax=Luedemannella helvata TaxID=349315 RepID=A0ABN2JQP3_9ACTN